MTAISSLIAFFSYAVALCGIVPLFPWLTTAPRLLLVAGLVAGAWQSIRGAWPLKNWLLNASIVPVFLFYAAQFSRSNAVQPVVSLLAVMLAVRLVGEKSGRHYLQILALSLFCLASSSLFDLSPLFLLYLALLLVLVALSLVLLAFHDQDSRMLLSYHDLRRVVVAGLLLPLASVPLLLFFFPLLPRTQIPLWDVSGAPQAQSSGFSDRVEPGRNEQAIDSPLLAFRAETPRQPQQRLYWRGAVFNRLEGIRWVRNDSVPPERPAYGSTRISQVIYPEPGLSRFLIALDVPARTTAIRARSNPDGTQELRSYGSRRLSYGADSSVGGVLAVTGGIDRDFYLQLPSTVPQAIARLAARIRVAGDTDERRAEALERYFRNNDYRYSMRGLPTGGHALERFLFETRQGHCEFFASSFALLARLAGIPARLVGGYLGGEYNEVGGYYLVTEGMAHVWVELFINGRGWVRVDPSSFARNADAVWGASRRRTLLQRLRMMLDSLDHAWNRSVISYDFERQVDAARSIAGHLQTLTLKRLLKGGVVLLGAISLVSLLLFLLPRRNALFSSREERLLRSLFRHLERECGVVLQPGRQGLFELADQADDERVREFVTIYASALYRDRRLTDREYERLRFLLRSGFVRQSPGKPR
jgi:transglutaminase-like putative cysteine protease